MSLSEKETQDILQEIAMLQSRIVEDIKRYNLLSSQADTDQRLALLSASSSKDDDDENKNMTHDEYVDQYQYDYLPYASIEAYGAGAWFPSSVGC